MKTWTRAIAAVVFLIAGNPAGANISPPEDEGPVQEQQAPSEARTAITEASQLVQKWASKADTSGAMHDMSAYRRQIEALHKIQATNTDASTGIALTYYIAELEWVVTADSGFGNGTPDRTLGQDALKNFDSVIAYGHDMPEWNIVLSSANYLAGSTAAAMDGMSSSLALRYWTVCAAQGHPGCINNVAFELGKPLTASDDDIRHILDLHAKVVATGTYAMCAGQFSAVSEAKLIHFTGVGRPGDDDIGLLDKAQTFYGQLKDRLHTADPCGGGRIGIDQYMMRLDRGERRPELLEDVEQHESSALWLRVASYLKGTTDEAGLAKAIAASQGFETCELHFYAAWKARQEGKKDAAQAHYDAMLKIDPGHCSPERMEMRRYLKASAPDKPRR